MTKFYAIVSKEDKGIVSSGVPLGGKTIRVVAVFTTKEDAKYVADRVFDEIKTKIEIVKCSFKKEDTRDAFSIWADGADQDDGVPR